jgi:VCBS repeat-containing protein
MQNHLFWIQSIRRLGTAALLAGLVLAGFGAQVTQAATPDKSITPRPPVLLETVSAGGSHTCGIKSDETLACWGNNASGQATPPAGNFTQVSAGGNHTCALMVDGTLACWGSNTSGQSTPPAGIFAQVSAGASHTCAIRTDGTIACWGSDASGQAAPPVGIFTQVSAGELHTCGLKNDASLACWGSNTNGQSAPPVGTYIQVESGGYHTCALKTDGTLVCWGDNRNGQTLTPGGTFTQISSGYWHSCAVQSNGEAVCWGDNRNGQAAPPTLYAGAYLQVSAGRYHTCAVRDDGTLNCWGRNTSGQAPTLAISPASLPFGEVGLGYNQSLSGGNGTAPYSFSQVSGSLPPGLGLSIGGLISGTPTLGGLYTFAVQVTDVSPLPFSTQRQYDLTVIINTPPEADNDAFTVSEDSANNPFDVLAGDTDIDDDPLTVSAVADSPHGTTLDNNTNVLYSPDPGYVGVDSFTYTVSDGMGGSDTATVTVTVTNVNDAPVADDDTFTVTEDT